MNFEIQTLDPVSYNDSTWWLVNEEGEGMGISDEKLIEFIKSKDRVKWFYEVL